MAKLLVYFPHLRASWGGNLCFFVSIPGGGSAFPSTFGFCCYKVAMQAQEDNPSNKRTSYSSKEAEYQLVYESKFLAVFYFSLYQ